MTMDIREISPRVAYAIKTYNEYNYPEYEIKSIQDLANLTSADILSIPGCGRKALQEVEKFLEKHGLSLAPSRHDVVLENRTSHPTLRDQFAMAALPGVINRASRLATESIADDCYKIADAMLKAREAK